MITGLNLQVNAFVMTDFMMMVQASHASLVRIAVKHVRMIWLVKPVEVDNKDH